MRFTLACLAHALERHYWSYRNLAIFIAVEAYVPDEIWGL
jgi:hypothetical protein